MIDFGVCLPAKPYHQGTEAHVVAWIRSAITTYGDAKVHYRGPLGLWLRGQGSLESYLFSDNELTVVCSTDLLNGVSQTSVNSVARQIADLYREDGDSFVRKLKGSFAIVLYDHRSDTLKAWTDHFAIRRLAYRAVADALVVSTRLDWLQTVLTDRCDLDPVAVVEYFQYACVPAPRTIYRDIFKLEAGHFLTNRPSLQSRPYWTITFDEGLSGEMSEGEWASALAGKIRDAVKTFLRLPAADSRIGCFLSGGTDSSSVVGLVRALTGLPPASFSIGFDDARYNEIEYARIAAKRFGCNHHEYFVKPDDILRLIPEACSYYGEPFGNASIVPTYFCARLARDAGISHLLAGDGGDEVFAGNERYLSDSVFKYYQLLPRTLRRLLIEPSVARLGDHTKSGVLGKASRYIWRAKQQLPDRLFCHSFLASTESKEIFDPEFFSWMSSIEPLARARMHYQEAPATHPLNRWLYLDLKMTISDNDLPKVTGMTELAGLTVRYPLLDPSLVEFAGRIPPGLKMKPGCLRYIFKKAMAEVLPAEIIKKTKHGFGLPYGIWLGEHAGLKQFTFDVLGSRRCRESGYFRSDLLEWLWSRYQRVNRVYYGAVMWMFLMFELWQSSCNRQRPTLIPEGPELLRAR
ncbi:MAG: asparagine synthase C-terminal domain-containing protein [Acidobacteriota bacterium]